MKELHRLHRPVASHFDLVFDYVYTAVDTEAEPFAESEFIARGVSTGIVKLDRRCAAEERRVHVEAGLRLEFLEARRSGCWSWVLGYGELQRKGLVTRTPS